jgi:hypothetical protein
LARLSLGLLGLLLLATLVFGIAAADKDGRAAGILLALFLVGALLAWRLARLSVVGNSQELVVRNHWSSTRLARAQVHDFEIGVSTSPIGRCVNAVTTDGRRVRLDVTVGSFSDQGRRQVQHRLGALRPWLLSPPPPLMVALPEVPTTSVGVHSAASG